MTPVPPPPSLPDLPELPKKQLQPEVPEELSAETELVEEPNSENDFTVKKIVGQPKEAELPTTPSSQEYDEENQVGEEEVTFTYRTPSPRVRTIFRIITITNIVMIVLGVSMAGIYAFSSGGMLEDFFWVPTQEQLSNFRIIFWSVFFFSIVWAVGMFKATTAHNRVLLQPWLEQQYGWSFTKEELTVLGTEDIKAYKENHKNGTYQSEVLPYQSPLADHRLVVFIQNEVPVLLDLNTREPMENAVNMYERHVYLNFRKKLWKHKNNVVYTLFTLSYKGAGDAFITVVWSDVADARAWIEERTAEGSLPPEALDAIVTGTLNDYFEHFNNMIAEHDDIKERGLLVGMGTEDAEVFFFSIEEFKREVLGEK